MRRLQFCLVFLSCLEASGQNIQSIAGGGPHNVPAVQTGLTLPYGLAVDSAGNVYVSASGANQIWKIDSSGKVNVFAGTGASSSDPGDGLLAINATLSGPRGLVFDSTGNLYVADTGNYRVRKISTSGIISTVAGSGTFGYSGDGGPATSAQMETPTSIAIDSANNLYIADIGQMIPYAPFQQGQHIRRVTSSGTISTFAGTGSGPLSGDGGAATSAGLNYPENIALDSTGALYVVESRSCRVRKIVNGVISTFAGNGVCEDTGDGASAAMAHLANPTSVAVDSFDSVYITESAAVRKIAARQSNIATLTTQSNTHSIAVDSSGNIYLGGFDFYLKKLTSGILSVLAGNGTNDYTTSIQNALNVNLLRPDFLAVDNTGSLYFADGGGSAIRKLFLSTGILSNAAGNGFYGTSPDGTAATGPLSNIFGLGFNTSGDFTFLETGYFDGIHLRRVSGNVFFTSGIVPTVNGGISASVVAANGDLYFSNHIDSQVHLLSKQTGMTSIFAGNGTYGSSGDGGLATNAALGYVSGLSLDGAGNLFVSDSFSIRKISLNTNLITTVPGAEANATSLFVDESDNLFFISGNTVKKLTAATGVSSIVAGNGLATLNGDGGPATSAGMSPQSIAIDRLQNLYIADNNGRIRSTTVRACFFTIGTPVVYTNRLGGSGSVSVSATNPDCPYSVASSLPFVTITGGASGMGSGTVTFSAAADAGPNRAANISVGGAGFSVTQAGAIGQQNVGYFQPSGGPWWVLDSNRSGQYEGTDKTFTFAGQAGAIAVVGDWNGDGRSKVGYYLNGFWALDYDGNGVFDSSDKFYAFGGGDSSFVPVVGDWNGNGKTKIGYYRNGFWVLDINGNGSFDSGDGFYGYGGNGAGELPVVGDWNGYQRTNIGFYYRGAWALDYNGNGTFDSADKYYTGFSYLAGDKPVVGDWNYDGKTKIGVYRSGFWVLDFNGNGTYDGTGAGGDKFYAFGGNSGEVPIVGDWNGDGRTKVGFYLNGFWALDSNGNGTFDGTGTGGDRFIAYGGTAGNQPLIGRW